MFAKPIYDIAYITLTLTLLFMSVISHSVKISKFKNYKHYGINLGPELFYYFIFSMLTGFYIVNNF